MTSDRSGVPPVEFDVFLSLGGPDRIEANLLKKALTDLGLRVFIDADDIAHFSGITDEIERALRSSRVLLAYYSREYPLRSACQFELTAALLAGRNQEDPTRHIVVVNPEPAEDHIQPAYISDARFAVRADNNRELRALAALIKQKVDAVQGTLGSVAFTRRPRWFAFRIAGAPGFVGRYRELWQLDSLLTHSVLPLTQDTPFGPVAVLTGAPGVGKTSLVAEYAWQFGAGFRGGVYWVDMAGVVGSGVVGSGVLGSGVVGSGVVGSGVRGAGSVDQVLAAYADRVRTTAEIAGLDVAGLGRERMFGVLGDHLAAAAEPSLWVVDGLPAGLGEDALHRMVVPAGTKVHTVFVGRRDPFGGAIPAMVLGGLGRDDARLLLTSYRSAEGAEEEAALDRLAERVGGHASALVLAGKRLKDRQGLRSYADVLADVEGAADVDRFFGGLVREGIGALDTVQTLVLAVASVCVASGIPAGLFARAVGTLAGTNGQADASAVGDALRTLQDSGLAANDDGRWQISAVARESAREQNPPGRARQYLQDVVAEAVTAMLRDPAASPADRLASVTHAVHLCDEAENGSRDTAVWLADLLELIAENYETRGEAASAVRYRDRLLAVRGKNTTDLLKAARTALSARLSNHAVDLARRALLLAADEKAHARRCRLVLAEALDGAMRFVDAEPYWDQVAASANVSGGLDPAEESLEQAAALIAHARSRIRRGELRAAKAMLRALTDEYARRTGDTEFVADTEVGEQIRAAYLEYAHVLSLIGDQTEARLVASGIVAFYRRTGRPRHADMVRAQEILAEAKLVPHIKELRLDDAARARAEQDIKQLWAANRLEDGPRSQSALSAGVGYAHALVSQGRKEQARDTLLALRTDIAAVREPRDPLYLRATFLLGQAYAQMNGYRKAVEMFRYAYENQREVLGPAHPYTLASGFELAVMLKTTGRDVHAGARLIRELDGLSARSMEYSSDLRPQVKVAKALIDWVPSPVWRWMRGPERDV